jgi:hypothetical protein
MAMSSSTATGEPTPTSGRPEEYLTAGAVEGRELDLPLGFAGFPVDLRGAGLTVGLRLGLTGAQERDSSRVDVQLHVRFVLSVAVALGPEPAEHGGRSGHK